MTGVQTCALPILLSHNLLVEEYPLSERDIKQIDESHWLLDTEVCNYLGIGRFVMGLAEDIEVIESPDFVDYLRQKIATIEF